MLPTSHSPKGRCQRFASSGSVGNAAETAKLQAKLMQTAESRTANPCAGVGLDVVSSSPSAMALNAKSFWVPSPSALESFAFGLSEHRTRLQMPLNSRAASPQLVEWVSTSSSAAACGSKSFESKAVSGCAKVATIDVTVAASNLSDVLSQMRAPGASGRDAATLMRALTPSQSHALMRTLSAASRLQRSTSGWCSCQTSQRSAAAPIMRRCVFSGRNRKPQDRPRQDTLPHMQGSTTLSRQSHSYIS
mmetsp:Transcript_36458/g.117477  ORF Transcript_36458/g.117477 Transcript_36458/m.117477 type:complete len:248 (+) Transcript_36458:2087-2830(+)